VPAASPVDFDSFGAYGAKTSSATVRQLVGLEDVVSMSVVDPIRDGRGLGLPRGARPRARLRERVALLREAYEATEPGYDGHISVPLLWDAPVDRSPRSLR
jgi:putative glutathione S-transferase